MRTSLRKITSVFDILKSYNLTEESEYESFVHAHVYEDCKEWRLFSIFGFGSKYRSETNTIDCYYEDETPERLELIKEINGKLQQVDELVKQYRDNRDSRTSYIKKFTNGNFRYNYSVLVHNIINALVSGTDPIVLLDRLCQLQDDSNESFRQSVINNPINKFNSINNK